MLVAAHGNRLVFIARMAGPRIVPPPTLASFRRLQQKTTVYSYLCGTPLRNRSSSLSLTYQTSPLFYGRNVGYNVVRIVLDEASEENLRHQDTRAC